MAALEGCGHRDGGPSRRTATVTARTDARLYALGKARFLASVGSHPRATREADRLVEERAGEPPPPAAPLVADYPLG